MSYSTWGSMTCEPFVYWGNIRNDWANFVRRVDVCEYIGKYRYIDDAIEYLDKVEFVNSNLEISEEDLDWDWFFNKRGQIEHCFSDYDFERTILFPLHRNQFPFVFVEEDQILNAQKDWEVERAEVCREIPEICETELDLEEYIKENCDPSEEWENLELWDIQISAPQSHLDKEQILRNYDEHMGVDALLAFLAEGGVVNRDFRSWMVSFHMIGEDGEEFSWARKIEGNEVVNPHEQKSFW